MTGNNPLTWNERHRVVRLRERLDIIGAVAVKGLNDRHAEEIQRIQRELAAHRRRMELSRSR